MESLIQLRWTLVIVWRSSRICGVGADLRDINARVSATHPCVPLRYTLRGRLSHAAPCGGPGSARPTERSVNRTCGLWPHVSMFFGPAEKRRGSGSESRRRYPCRFCPVMHRPIRVTERERCAPASFPCPTRKPANLHPRHLFKPTSPHLTRLGQVWIRAFFLFHRARRIFFLMLQKENGGCIPAPQHGANLPPPPARAALPP